MQLRFVILASLGSAVLMLGAVAFQYLGDMAPCKMCYWQRYPHIAAVLIGVGFLFKSHALLPWLGAASTMATSGVGFFHAGVERGVWPGPQSCTSSPIDDLSTEELVAQIMAAPMVRCNDIPWEMFGVSIAGWNALLSLGLTAVWLWGATHRKEP